LPNEVSKESSQEGGGRGGVGIILLVFGGLFFLMVISFAMLFAALSEDGLSFSSEGIGVIEVIGPITENKEIVSRIRSFAKDEKIRGVVVRVDSPGGAVAPSQEIYEAVKRLAKQKPLAVSMGGTAASGGYYIACGSDKIFANPGTITGSIGVITQLFDVTGILDIANVQVNTVKTGHFKDSGSPFRAFDAEDEAYFEALIEDIHGQFIEAVAECRKLEVDEVKKLADGRVYSGRQAKELKLVDELGSFEDAVAHVAAEAGIEGDPNLIYPPEKDLGFLKEAIQGAVQGLASEAKMQVAPAIEYRYTGPR
jgi:protease IV